MDLFRAKMNNYLEEAAPLQDNSEGSSVPQQCMYYYDLLTKYPHIKRIVEIGFNVGISAAAFLSVRPDIEVISFDICSHDYVFKIKNVLDKHFPDRHTLIYGDSTKVVPMLRRFFDGFKPVDLFFVDGWHKEPVPRLDIMNALEWCNSESLLMVDDVCPAHGSEGVVQAVLDCATQKKIEIIDHLMYQDRGWVICKKI
jgi:predicted O-methyltransferase YrrM